jgi:ADP-ribose pyrophosphatase YjhB (NUDIX family)
MQVELTVPEGTGKDIKSVYVVDEGSLDEFLRRFTLDQSYSPVPVQINESLGFKGYHDKILEAALKNSTNLVALLPGGIVNLYRVQEQKRAGREYPGVGVGILIFNDPGEVLLTLRSGTTNNRPGIWDLPGGTNELGDGLEKTVVDEALQETGLIVKPEGCVNISEDMVDGQHWISFAYVARVIGGELDPTREGYKFDDMRFFPTDKFPDNTADLTRNVVESHAKGGDNYIPIDQIFE